ncbi:unnamed protein product [Tilletia caries]|uniref:Beta-glucuronidase C-terminal domain-containing protein n=3 Tax=Tilletia TaxID=13289 RepID=A0A8X7MQD6_9BASI|nr:hypothetical protein CF328_g3002 [Tilletia controversa]KAE8245119.1 hypothetical protein A4X06_0g5815 [Tilletia controversa]KAE8257458.1 hypothetical protein A4X03_0g4660 [Tilletia caries]CAD6904667.1 unnamed protein product [Tilletia caries]CAD7059669.1 unnamed protein product [Tilletia caries]
MLTRYYIVLLAVITFLAATSTSILAQDLNTAFTILAAPATPTSMELFRGPEPQPTNFTAEPLPVGPTPALGSTVIQLDLLGDGAIAGIPVPANFLGISIELSVSPDIFGYDTSTLHAPFLNYIASISARLPLKMGPAIRVGGNTQDRATYKASGAVPIVKESGPAFNLTNGAPVTPKIQVSSKLFDIMQAIGEPLRVQWVFGVNMAAKDAKMNRLMVKDITKALGNQLRMLLVGNEPDRYAQNEARDPDYSINDYLDDWDAVTSNIEDEVPTSKFFVGPSVCCGWKTNDILIQSGMANRFKDRLAAVSGIKYPQSLCSAYAPKGHDFYLNHGAIVHFSKHDEDAVQSSVDLGIPFILIETNSASCIGVRWVSNAFSSTLWAIDAALQRAYRNHSGVYLHTSGNSVLYNLFTPPGHKQSIYSAWRTGPIMYALPFVAEALNSTSGRNVRVRDLGMQTPAGTNWGAAYGIYDDEEAQVAIRVVLINFASASSNSDAMQVQIPVGTQRQVLIKYMSAPTAAEQQHITWAGQTFGYYSNGMLSGKETIYRLQCDSGAGNSSNTCTVTVPAPGAAIVYLSDKAQATAAVASRSMGPFIPQGIANPGVIIKSNGGRGRKGGATSRHSSQSGGGTRRAAVVGATLRALLVCMVAALTMA